MFDLTLSMLHGRIKSLIEDIKDSVICNKLSRENVLDTCNRVDAIKIDFEKLERTLNNLKLRYIPEEKTESSNITSIMFNKLNEKNEEFERRIRDIERIVYSKEYSSLSVEENQ